MGALDAGHMVFVFVLMASSLLSIAYLMPVVVRAFFFEPDPDDHHGHDEHHGHAPQGEAKEGFWANLHEAPMLCVMPLCLTAVGCIALFFYAPEIYNLVITITEVK
jgi:multicomponent Na+:H+ antiporter subunit D